jgi:hypothetical protein
VLIRSKQADVAQMIALGRISLAKQLCRIERGLHHEMSLLQPAPRGQPLPLPLVSTDAFLEHAIAILPDERRLIQSIGPNHLRLVKQIQDYIEGRHRS